MIITRFAPSPTGQLHIGHLAGCLIDYMVARQNGGKFFLRIEDTDQKREVQGSADSTIKWLKVFGFEYDGEPVIQSARADIYKKYAEQLVNEDKAYHDDGAIRFRAPQPKPTIEWHDLVKGDMRLPGLERDPVILKSNGLPPYNLAHVVDDTIMGTTHVVRGEEWLVSTAEHIQLFRAFGFTPPHYVHYPVISIVENGNKRKLSKRKDKEALVENFIADGYPTDSIIEYVLTLLNTDYEIWRIKNPNTPWREFTFRFEKIGSNSPLFDWNKLNDISKNIIAKMTCAQIDAAVDVYFATQSHANIQKIKQVLAIDRETEKPRKDVAKWSDVLTLYDYLFTAPKATLTAEQKRICREYAKVYNPSDTKEEWFARIKTLCPTLVYCDNMKEYKQNPSAHKGHIGDVTQAIRLATTGRENTPDLFAILNILGAPEAIKRLSK